MSRRKSLQTQLQRSGGRRVWRWRAPVPPMAARLRLKFCQREGRSSQPHWTPIRRSTQGSLSADASLSGSTQAIDHPGDEVVANAPPTGNQLYLPLDTGMVYLLTKKLQRPMPVLWHPPVSQRQAIFTGMVRDLAIGVPNEDIIVKGGRKKWMPALYRHVFYGTSKGGLTTSGTDFWNQGFDSYQGGVERQAISSVMRLWPAILMAMPMTIWRSAYRTRQVFMSM